MNSGQFGQRQPAILVGIKHREARGCGGAELGERDAAVEIGVGGHHRLRERQIGKARRAQSRGVIGLLADFARSGLAAAASPAAAATAAPATAAATTATAAFAAATAAASAARALLSPAAHPAAAYFGKQLRFIPHSPSKSLISLS
jgi:hypothetical protein